MNHDMNLYDDPFEAIRSKEKLVEIRLWDEKRQQLKVNDTITFEKTSDPLETLTVRVIALDFFPTFKQMYETLPAQVLGAHGQTVDQMIQDTYEIYSPEQEKQWGTVAIHIELID